MKTTGRCSGAMCLLRWCSSSSRDGILSPRTPISLSMAPVQPDPAKITTVSSPPPTAAWMIARASSRKRVVCSPVPLDSVWVLAYLGNTSKRMKSSRKVSARPEAV